MEDGGEVMIVIELSQPSSKPFDVMVSLMNVTAKCEYNKLLTIFIKLIHNYRWRRLYDSVYHH